MSVGTVLFSGGGSAGHLAPGFAMAEALEARGIRTLFSTPGESSEASWFHGRAAPAYVPAARLPRGPGAAIRFVGRTLRGVRGAKALLRREGVGLVVGLGGWPCVPVLMAARRARVPYVLVCPDAVPGKVVRRLAKRSAGVFLAHADAARGVPNGVPVSVHGPWIRGSIREGRRDASAFGLDGSGPVLLVLGGSLGAQGFFARWFEAVEGLEPSEREGLQVIHALGRTGAPEAARARYADMGVRAHVVGYLEQMGDAYATADLVLARAGANTCAELVATRRPALLVPYPHHADRQQFLNAAPLVEAGGARLLAEETISTERIREECLALLHDGARRATMSAALTALEGGGADATADALAALLETRAAE